MTLGGELTDLCVNLCLSKEKAAKVGCETIPRPTSMEFDFLDAFFKRCPISNCLCANTPAAIETCAAHMPPKCVPDCLEISVRNKTSPYLPKGRVCI